MAKDWLTETNDFVDALHKNPDHGDRYLLEVFICFVNEKKLGKEFVSFLKSQPEVAG